MEIQYSIHAESVIAERNINKEWISATIRNPMRIENDNIDKELSHYLRKIPEKENRVLRVILNANENPPKIVTVYFDRNVREIL